VVTTGALVVAQVPLKKVWQPLTQSTPSEGCFHVDEAQQSVQSTQCRVASHWRILEASSLRSLRRLLFSESFSGAADVKTTRAEHNRRVLNCMVRC